MLRNTSQSYGLVSITLHWLMALLIVAMFALGLYMVNLTYADAWYKAAPEWHTSTGVLLLLLLTFRFGWRLSNPRPEMFAAGFEKTVALLVHRLHYVFMAALMLSGFLITTADGRGIEVFGWFEVPAVLPAEKGREETAGFTHMILAWAFMAFVLLHALASLKHHFIDKDRTLTRMLGIKKERGSTR